MKYKRSDEKTLIICSQFKAYIKKSIYRYNKK